MSKASEPQDEPWEVIAEAFCLYHKRQGAKSVAKELLDRKKLDFIAALRDVVYELDKLTVHDPVDYGRQSDAYLAWFKRMIDAEHDRHKRPS